MLKECSIHKCSLSYFFPLTLTYHSHPFFKELKGVDVVCSQQTYVEGKIDNMVCGYAQV